MKWTNWLWRRTLVRRVVFTLLCAYPLVWIVLTAYEYVQVTDQQKEDHRLRKLVGVVTAEVAQVHTPDEARAAAAVTGRLVNQFREPGGTPDVIVLQLLDRSNGRLLYSSAAQIKTLLPGEARHLTDLPLNGRMHRLLKDDTARWSVAVAVPRVSQPWLLMVLGLEITRFMAIAFPLVLVPIWWAVSHGMRPLRRLSERIAARGADDLSAIGFEAKHEELKPLVAALDTLMLQLKQKIKREHAFVQDAAHELRTPIAVISAQAHVLAMAQTPTERQQAEQQLDGAIARASHLIRQLLALAQVDSDQPDRNRAVDIAQLVRQALAQAATQARASTLDLSLEAPDALHGNVDVLAFESVLHNLLDNAIRYARPGGRVLVEMKPAQGALALAVADDGPGIAASERELVFERFYRGNGHDVAGSGLGLAIVKQATARLGGSVCLSEGLDGKGCRFEVVLPMTTPGRV